MKYYQYQKTKKVEEKVNLKSIYYEDKKSRENMIEFYLNQIHF